MVSKNEHYLKTKCPVACGLDLIGDHWTLVIIRDLMFNGKHEFKEFLASEEAIASNILTDRLKKLEQAEIIAVIPHPNSKLRKLYYLTETGKDLFDIMMAIIKWSDRHLKDRIFIPPEKRLYLDLPAKEVKQMLLEQFTEWERRYIKDA